jgi:hypothetical protein
VDNWITCKRMQAMTNMNFRTTNPNALHDDKHFAFFEYGLINLFEFNFVGDKVKSLDRGTIVLEANCHLAN